VKILKDFSPSFSPRMKVKNWKETLWLSHENIISIFSSFSLVFSLKKGVKILKSFSPFSAWESR
jgi:hypothetical protein